MTRRVIALGVAGLLAWAPEAAAQDSKADAERLFREAQTLLERGRYGEACPKFESSYKKDRQLGTLLNLAYCHKQEGRQWFAWLEFKEAELVAAAQGRKERVEFARARLAELEKTLPRAKLSLNKSVQLTQVLVEDRTVPDAENGAVFTMDPGERKIVFIAPGKKPATKLVNVTKSDRPLKISVPDMEDAPPDAPPPAVEPDEPPLDKPKPEQPPADKPRDGSSQRTLAWVSFGGAAVAAGIGSVFGLTAVNKFAEVDPLRSVCRPGACSATDSAAWTKIQEEASSAATVATIAFVAAGALAVTGVVLLVTAPPRDAPAKGGITVQPIVGLGFGAVRATF
ncbi:MAG: hypothetical protein KC657_11500 [Myxococcales bacterium]|nr:hypothetical protein [Myxococcales bacterium]